MPSLRVEIPDKKKVGRGERVDRIRLNVIVDKAEIFQEMHHQKDNMEVNR